MNYIASQLPSRYKCAFCRTVLLDPYLDIKIKMEGNLCRWCAGHRTGPFIYNNIVAKKVHKYIIVCPDITCAKKMPLERFENHYIRCQRQSQLSKTLTGRSLLDQYSKEVEMKNYSLDRQIEKMNKEIIRQKEEIERLNEVICIQRRTKLISDDSGHGEMTSQCDDDPEYETMLPLVQQMQPSEVSSSCYSSVFTDRSPPRLPPRPIVVDPPLISRNVKQGKLSSYYDDMRRRAQYFIRQLRREVPSGPIIKRRVTTV